MGTVKKLKHTGGYDKPGPKGQRDTRAKQKQLALEPPKDSLKSARDQKRVRIEGTLDFDRQGYIGLRGKYYKRGLLVKLLIHSFGYTYNQAQSLCFSVVLSSETDPSKRHAECTQHSKAGHKTATDSCHAFSKTAELLRLYDAQYQKEYVVKKPDFR
jgi:hypothetical protein